MDYSNLNTCFLDRECKVDFSTSNRRDIVLGRVALRFCLLLPCGHFPDNSEKAHRARSQCCSVLNTPQVLDFSNHIHHLGHLLRPGCLAVSDRPTKEIEGLRTLTSITKLRFFSGLREGYRRFGPKSLRRTVSSTKQWQKDQPYQFHTATCKELEAVKTLKKKLISLSVLAMQRREGLLPLIKMPVIYQPAVPCDKTEQKAPRNQSGIGRQP